MYLQIILEGVFVRIEVGGMKKKALRFFKAS
jgi:hypothetical protein